jgi:hypothetical protein
LAGLAETPLILAVTVILVFTQLVVVVVLAPLAAAAAVAGLALLLVGLAVILAALEQTVVMVRLELWAQAVVAEPVDLGLALQLAVMAALAVTATVQLFSSK